MSWKETRNACSGASATTSQLPSCTPFSVYSQKDGNVLISRDAGSANDTSGIVVLLTHKVMRCGRSGFRLSSAIASLFREPGRGAGGPDTSGLPSPSVTVFRGVAPIQ